MSRCLDPTCHGTYTLANDGVTVWHGMHLHMTDLSDRRCTVCHRSYQDIYEGGSHGRQIHQHRTDCRP